MKPDSAVRATRRRYRYAQRKLVGGRLISPTGPHGTASTYKNNGCRCKRCTAAHLAQVNADRAVRHARTAANGGIAPSRVHNAATYANWGCRCQACVAGWNGRRYNLSAAQRAAR